MIGNTTISHLLVGSVWQRPSLKGTIPIPIWTVREVVRVSARVFHCVWAPMPSRIKDEQIPDYVYQIISLKVLSGPFIKFK